MMHLRAGWKEWLEISTAAVSSFQGNFDNKDQSFYFFLGLLEKPENAFFKNFAPLIFFKSVFENNHFWCVMNRKKA